VNQDGASRDTAREWEGLRAVAGGFKKEGVGRAETPNQEDSP
jgi:hypothetical protein